MFRHGNEFKARFFKRAPWLQLSAAAMDESKEKRIADTLNQLKKDRFVSNLSPNDQLGIVDYFEDFFCSDGCGDDHSGNAIIAFMHALIFTMNSIIKFNTIQ